MDWGTQGSGKHMEAQAGPPGAQAATDWAKLHRCSQQQLRWTGVESPQGWGVAKAPETGIQG